MRRLKFALGLFFVLAVASGCTTLSYDEEIVHLRDLSQVQPPREDPVLSLSFHNLKDQTQESFLRAFRATKLFSEVEEQTYSGKGLHISISAYAHQEGAGGLPLFSGFASIFTLGIVPMTIRGDVTYQLIVSRDAGRLKTLKYKVPTKRLVSVGPIPSVLLFGDPPETANKVAVVRLTTTAISDLKKSGVVFEQ